MSVYRSTAAVNPNPSPLSARSHTFTRQYCKGQRGKLNTNRSADLEHTIISVYLHTTIRAHYECTLTLRLSSIHALGGLGAYAFTNRCYRTWVVSS